MRTLAEPTWRHLGDRRVRRWCELLLVVGTLGTRDPSSARADVTTTPYPGVTHIYRSTATQKIHVVEIDTSLRTIRLRATPPAGGGQTVPAFAAGAGVHVAINGDFGTRVAPWKTSGLAMGAGDVWTNTKDSTIEGFIAFGRDNSIQLSAPADVLAEPEDWMSEIVGGRPLIVEDGVALAAVPPYSRDGCAPHFCQPEPRSAVGVAADGTTLILATVDGRRSGANGMTTQQLGALMVELGAHRALNIDGGGSTTLWIENEAGVVNQPSDGCCRVVSNHLGIEIVEPFGDVTGYVRREDIFDETQPIAGATVTLSSGETAVTGADGAYRFTRVAAGDVAITATADGYAARAIDRYVAADDTTWGSIALFEPDDEAGADAGASVEEGPGGGMIEGACAVAPHGGRPWGGALLALALLIHRRRRRLAARARITTAG
jgi:MYXO-CTERM domain-containing protein